MSVTGFSTQHDGEVQQYKRTRTIILAQQEQRRQEFRRQLGLPEACEEDRSFFRRIFHRESKQKQFLDKQLVQRMAAGNVEVDGSEDDSSLRKVERVVLIKQ